MRSIFDYHNDKAVEKITIGDKESLEVDLLTYGATISSIRLSNRLGCVTDLALGFDQLLSYISHGFCFGATIGRYANRIKNGRFTLDQKEYKVTQNLDPHHLHGGAIGFDKVIWDLLSVTPTTVHMEYVSKDMEEGFPGTVVIQVKFEIKNECNLSISFTAETDKPTPINLTNHTYFNLNGAGQGNVLDHVLQIDADKITMVDEALIPTGQLMDVAGSPYDFTKSRKIGIALEEGKCEEGYDHNYVINSYTGELRKIAALQSMQSGVGLNVYTTEPGVHLYTANGLDQMSGKGGVTYTQYGGVCLETQHFPDSPNHPSFPSTILRPNDTFKSQTEFRFTAHDVIKHPK